MGTIVFVDGFDDYDPADATDFAMSGWSAGPYSSAGAGRYGGMAAAVYNSNQFLSLPPATKYTVAFGWMCVSDTLSFSIGFRESTTSHASLSYNGSAKTFTIAGVTSPTLTVGNGVWHHLEVEVEVHDTNGTATVRYDGGVIIEATSKDTRNGGTGVIDNIVWAVPTGAAAYIDDFVAMKDGGLVGDCRVVTQWPIDDGGSSDWASSGTIPDISFVGYSFLGATAADSIAWPSHEEGDLGLLLVETSDSAAVATTSYGIPVLLGDIATTGTRLTAYAIVALKNAMPMITIYDPGDHLGAALLVFRDCASSAIDAYAFSSKESASTSISISGVTTSVDGAYIVNIATRDNDSATAEFGSWANANLVSITELVDVGTASGNGGGIGVAGGRLATAGSSGSTTATTTNSVQNANLCIALRPANSGSKAGMVQDLLQDGDSTYVSATSVLSRDTYDFPDLGVVGTVKAVSVSHVSRKTDAGARKISTVVRKSGTNYDGTGKDIASSYTRYQEIWTSDPSSSAEWSVSGVNAAEFGIKIDT